MKKAFWLPVILAGSFSLFPQQVTEESVVINIEVPVRVFEDGRFIDDLTIQDFEVFEDGKSQKIEAVYLVKKTSVERSEESRRFAPNTERNFYLFFEINEYDPRLGKSLSQFIQNEIYPSDNLWIITPDGTYHLRGEALGRKSRAQIVEQLIGIMRRDILAGNFEYRSTMADLAELTLAMTEDPLEEELEPMMRDGMGSYAYEGLFLDEKIYKYVTLIGQLDNYNLVSEKKMLDFAEVLKYESGQKYVFIFYEKEYIPMIDPSILQGYMTRYNDRPDIMQTLTTLYDFYNKDIPFNIDIVKQAYADASIAIHFLYLTGPATRTDRIVMRGISDSTFSAFKEMSKATGGFVETSNNPEHLFREALNASENYYLLYYTPKNYTSDGKFRSIEVRVPARNLRVIHRLGYLAE
ncbi:MAG: hypothetical protein ACERK6_08115 [Candidatus Aminicenantaceae bacterium]